MNAGICPRHDGKERGPTREWNIGTPDETAVRTLCAGGVPPVLAELLALRGAADVAQARAFLRGGDMRDPLLMMDMPVAAARVRRACETGETVCVWGDYDVDGVTATALLLSFLRERGADAFAYLPSRESEGYGLNAPGLARVAQAGATLVVTVDTGVSALEEAAAARALGLELVITDHHAPRDALPEALAVVNPHRADCPYPCKYLAGVGVAFKLACAAAGAEQADALLARYAALLCLGTVADVVPLLEENRLFVRAGLKRLRAGGEPGVAALLEVAGAASRPVDAALLAFTAAPRLNAAGRMGSAWPALELLLTRSQVRANLLAGELQARNDARRTEEERILEEALVRIDAQRLLEKRVLIVDGEGWKDGVIGIAAARLAERFERPAMVVSFREDEGRASCRSFAGFALHEALAAAAPLLLRFGGHELAAGFSIARENLPAFRAAMEAFAAAHVPHPALRLDMALPPERLTLETVKTCRLLEPCGAGNPAPLFYLEDVLLTAVRPLSGGRHLRFSCRMGAQTFEALYFGAARAGRTFAAGDLLDLAVELAADVWRGRRQLCVRVRAARESAAAHARCRALLAGQAEGVRPTRAACAAVWRVLAGEGEAGLPVSRLCGRMRLTDEKTDDAQILLILHIFEETGLVRLSEDGAHAAAAPRTGEKVRLDESPLMRRLSPRRTEG